MRSAPVLLQAPVEARDHVLGPKAAPLTLLEYGDYECPFCGQAVGIIKALRQALGSDLRYVFRNFPLVTIHAHALDAAKVAEAADLQGKFWQMHELLFETQDELDEDSLLDTAASVDLDYDRFVSDLKDPEVEQRIEIDIRGGIRSQVEGTPTFFINGIRYEGDWSYEALLNYLTEFRMLISSEASRRRAA